jgi:hypothetical protein
MQNSKINTVLLVILIILVGAGLWFMVSKKDTTVNVQQDTTPVSQIPSQNTISNTNNNTVKPAEKQYAGIGIRFSYNPSATTWLSSDRSLTNGTLTKTNVGTSTSDPYLEAIVLSELPFNSSGGYVKLAPEKYGPNTFDVYQYDESGTRVYILQGGRGNILVTIPFRAGGNATTKYIDLASVSFN